MAQSDPPNTKMLELAMPALDCSPTPTPYHTRAGSPVRGISTPHTAEQAKETMEAINALMPEDSEVTDARDASKPEKAELISVSIVDGSANVSAASKIVHLSIYFTFNLGLTLFNKAIMVQFPFPFLLTALHAAAGVIGTTVLSSRGTFTPKPLTSKDTMTLCAFSILYTFNIAVSNVSLAMVTVPFHQVIRATTPVFTVAIYRIFFSSAYSLATYVSLIPVVLGVGLATYGDYYATMLGFCLTLLGAVLASTKTVITNRMQTAGMHISAMDLLHRLSPLAAIQSTIVAYYFGELDSFQKFAMEPGNMNQKTIIILLINATMALGLNIASFTANKKAGALTMTVAANVKQILTVLLAIMFWHLKVGWVNACGITITLLGSVWYARVELMGKKQSEDFRYINMEEGKIVVG